MNKARQRLNSVLFEADTVQGRIFDLVLLACIVLSIVTVMLESVSFIQTGYARVILVFELLFTSLFTLEYLLRIYAARQRRKYICSFFGIIDFIAVIPTWIALFSFGYKYLIIIRVFRLFRVLRILKLTRFVGEAEIFSRALMASRYKISVFVAAVTAIVVILGTLMYVVEGEGSGFTSIPKSIYWAIITLTTVGFGDIVPRTVIGQAVSSFVMILGYGIIAIPTGILTSETLHEARKAGTCPACGRTGHDADAAFCKYCGRSLSRKENVPLPEISD